MKVIKELSLLKILKFVYFSVVQIVYHLTIDHIFNLPQFRKIFFQVFGANIGQDSILMNVKVFNLLHKGLSGLIIGKECFIGDETLLDLYDKIILEDQVTIAQRVTVLTHTNVGYKNHPLQKYFPKNSKPVIFKKGCVVGAGSIVLPGIIVGENSFIAAGSVVTKNVQPNTLIGGNPAKIIKKIH